MDFSLTDDQRLIRDTIRQFMEAEVRPSIRARDREEKFAAAELRKLGELGCCGMLVPESWGGASADTISYVLMLEEVARVDAAMAVALSVTNSLAAFPLAKYGTEDQRQKYLPRLAHGEILGHQRRRSESLRRVCKNGPVGGIEGGDGISRRAVISRFSSSALRG